MAWRRVATWAARMLGRDRSGSVSVLVAASGACLIGCLAISVDLAHVYLVRRENQGALDLAALAAARNLATANHAARVALAQNKTATFEKLSVVVGSYSADPKKAPEARFVAGGAPANAVRLQMTTKAPLFFGRALTSDPPHLTTTSIGVNTRLASFTVGSRAASLQGGVANALLSNLLGASASLTVMDYNSLADAKIELPALLSAVASRARLTAATYDDVLKADITTGVLLAALSDVAAAGPAKLALQQLARTVSTKALSLGRMISLGPLGSLKLGKDLGVSASASVLQTLMTALELANGSRQIDLDLGVSIPGLLGVTASVTIGERPQNSPWFALDREGATVRTAQTRIRLAATVGGVLGLATLRLPVAVDVAAAEATLSSAQCGRTPKTDEQATLLVTPSLAKVWIGEPKSVTRWNDMSSAADIGPATIVDTLLLSATAQAYVGVSNVTPVKTVFTAANIQQGATKTVSTSSIAQSTLASLTQNLAISVNLKLLGLSLGTPQSVSNLLAATLAPVGALLDPVLNSLLQQLGVGLGQADVTVRGIRCDGSALVG